MHEPKFADTDADELVELIRSRRKEVEPGTCAGIDTALALLPREAGLTIEDLRQWVCLILDAAPGVATAEIPGLVEALECVLSIDDRDAGQLVDRARRRGSD
jgi:hypothetical protein